MTIVLVIALWVLFGLYNWGFTLGHFTHAFPDGRHESIAAKMVVLGPLAFLSVTMFTVFTGSRWQLKPYTKQQRWAEFHRMYPNLDRKYFETWDSI